MATEAILVDVGVLYKRLFNHRPIIQNEVNYFVKEFESKREDGDMKTMQDTMSKADEINNVFLTEIMCSNPQFKTIQEKANTIRSTCEEILSQEKKDLWISHEEQEKLDQQLEEYREQLKQKEQEVVSVNEQDILKLKEEIDELRQSRTKLRSHASSLSSSITIYPSATTSPDGEVEGGEGEVLADGEVGQEAGQEGETSQEAGQEEGETSQEAGQEEGETSQEAGQEEGETSQEAGQEEGEKLERPESEADHNHGVENCDSGTSNTE